MAPKTNEKIEWKRMKRIIVGRQSIKNLKSMDPKILINTRNSSGKSILHVATKHAFLEVNKYLIDIGCEVNLVDLKKGNTPMTLALNRTDDAEGEKIVKLLLNSGAEITINQSQILFDNPEITSKLLVVLKSHMGGAEAVADYFHSKGWTLDDIARLKDKDITKFTLRSDINLMANCRALFSAMNHEDVHQFKFLVEPLLYSKRITTWALLKAARTRSPKSTVIIKLLLDRGVSVHGFEGDKITPLEQALLHYNIDNSLVLFEHGAKLEDRSIFFILRQAPKTSYSARMCIRLLFEFQGLWNGVDSEKKFENIFWLSHDVWADLPILNLITQCLAKERHSKGPEDAYIPQNYKMWRTDYFKCSKILCDMKKSKIENVSVWSLAMKTIDELIPFTRNERLTKIIKSAAFCNSFQRHARTLQFKMSKALEKRLLMDRTIVILRECLPMIRSCDPVLEKIVYYVGVPNLLCIEETDFFSSVFV